MTGDTVGAAGSGIAIKPVLSSEPFDRLMSLSNLIEWMALL